MIPAERTEIAVSLERVASLPEGAEYSSRSGRASARLSLRGDTLIVSAGCDSIAAEAELWEERYWCLRDSVTNHIRDSTWERRDERVTESRSSGIWTAVKWLIIGAAIGFALAVMMIIKTQKRG